MWAEGRFFFLILTWWYINNYLALRGRDNFGLNKSDRRHQNCKAMRNFFDLLAHGSSKSLSHSTRRDWLLHCYSQRLLNVTLIWLATSTYRMGPFCQTQALKKDVKEKYVNRRVRQYSSRRLGYPQVVYCGRHYFLRIYRGGQSVSVLGPYTSTSFRELARVQVVLPSTCR